MVLSNYSFYSEKDLNNVLQSTKVFTNVSKGQIAKTQDLEKAFQKMDEEEICKLV